MRKIKFRKGVAIALALTLSLSMMACGEKKATPNTDPTETPAEEQTGSPLCIEDADVSYGQVAMGGGGFVAGLISTSDSGVYYARTDVGGAYRWDSGNARWVSLSYDITEAERGLLGIDGLAVDPKNPAKISMLCGTSYFSSGMTCIFTSEDYGETFNRVDVSDMIRCHGNGMGRQNGERIAIDPNNSNIILAGGRTGGLIRSTDGGQTFEAINFPVTETKNGNGICSIVFDGSQVGMDDNTSRIYVAVSQTGGECLYVSEDGGDSFNKIEGFPINYMPVRLKLAPDGDLLIVCSSDEGPWNGHSGDIKKYNPSTKEFISIAPGTKSFGDIVFNPENPNQMLCCTENVWSEQPNGAYGDIFYVSNDGGETWEDIMSKMTMSTNGIEWIKDYAIHWCGSLMIDPVDTGKVMVTSGNGVFACDNIWSDAPEFYFNAQGIEETVPLDLVSIKGGPLVSAIGDYDGFVHDDIYEFPQRYTYVMGTNTGIAVGGMANEVWVRVGNSDEKNNLIYSLDSGLTWTVIDNSPSSEHLKGGSVAVTADGKNIIWSPENGSASYMTSNYGESWVEVANLPINSYVIADTVNSDYVYANSTYSFLISSDGGKTFTASDLKVNEDIRIATVSGKEGGVFIPANMKGLYYTEDHGETVTQVKNVKWCNIVGTGIGMNPDMPAIYIWGRVEGATEIGVYGSFDNGEHWVHLNDSGVEFGGTGNGHFITGDNNTFGRCYMSTVGLGLIYFQYNE